MCKNLYEQLLELNGVGIHPIYEEPPHHKNIRWFDGCVSRSDKSITKENIPKKSKEKPPKQTQIGKKSNYKGMTPKIILVGTKSDYIKEKDEINVKITSLRAFITNLRAILNKNNMVDVDGIVLKLIAAEQEMSLLKKQRRRLYHIIDRRLTNENK